MIVDVIVGFLGSGKTTFIQQVIAAVSGQEKLAVIVNEFGDIGIDGTVLSQHDGVEVTELASGCICCSLSRDLVRQVEMLAREYAPDRLLIEPSGVATVESLFKALRSLRLENYINEIRVVCILDAFDFHSLYEQNSLYLASQIRTAGLIIINKTDRADAEELAEIMAVVTGLNRQARVIATSYCRFDSENYLCLDDISEEWAKEQDTAASPPAFAHQFEKVSFLCTLPCKAEELHSFLSLLQSGKFGEVARAKGIINIQGSGTVLFHLASGAVTVTPLARAVEQGKVFIAGTELKREKLLTYFSRCGDKAVMER